MDWLPLITNLLKAFRSIADAVQSFFARQNVKDAHEAGVQAGRDEVASRVNQETAETLEKMGEVSSDTSDAAVEDWMQNGGWEEEDE